VLAGHSVSTISFLLRLEQLTLDAMANVTQSEDAGKRYEAYGFDVQRVDDTT